MRLLLPWSRAHTIRPTRTTSTSRNMKGTWYIAVTVLLVALAASNAAASTSRRANSAAKTSEETISHSEQRAVEEPSRTAAIRDPDAPQGRWFGWFGWGHKYPYYQTYHYPSYNYYNSYYCKPKPYYYGGSYNNNYNNNYNSYAYRSAGGDTDDEIKPRQAMPRDQLGVRAMQRQTVAAKRQIASTCAEWLGVSLDEISSAPDEVKVQDDACCYPSGCALAPSAGSRVACRIPRGGEFAEEGSAEPVLVANFATFFRSQTNFSAPELSRFVLCLLRGTSAPARFAPRFSNPRGCLPGTRKR